MVRTAPILACRFLAVADDVIPSIHVVADRLLVFLARNAGFRAPFVAVVYLALVKETILELWQGGLGAMRHFANVLVAHGVIEGRHPGVGTGFEHTKRAGVDLAIGLAWFVRMSTPRVRQTVGMEID